MEPNISIDTPRYDATAVEILARELARIKEQGQTAACDRTFHSVVIRTIPGGRCVVLDETGTERTVTAAIPQELSAGQNIWVKIPCGNLSQMHICGLA